MTDFHNRRNPLTAVKIVIADGDPNTLESVGTCCATRWPSRSLLSTVSTDELLSMVEHEAPDLVLLDAELSDRPGYAVCREIRAFSAVPLIVINSSDEEDGIIGALDAGADDCISKPIRPMELQARIMALLRRTQKLPLVGATQPYKSDDLYINFDTYEVVADGEEINLTFTEFEILRCLVNNSGRVISHSQLAWQIWGEDGQCPRNALKVHIQHLRHKLGETAGKPRYIINERGLGYKFSPA